MCTQPQAVPVISLANNFLSLLFIDDRRHSSQVHWLFPDFKGGQVTKASTIQEKLNAGGEGPSQSISRGVYVQGKAQNTPVRIKIWINSIYQLPELVHGSGDGQVIWDVPATWW